MRTRLISAWACAGSRFRIACVSAIVACTLSAVTATALGATGRSGSPTRQEIVSINRGMTRTAVSFMQLDRSQSQRLTEMLAEMELVHPETLTPRNLTYYRNAAAKPGQRDSYTTAVVREFGGAVGRRWNTWRDLYIGFAPVDQMLRDFYNDGVPITQVQRLKLAKTYSDVEIKFPLWPVEESATDEADASLSGDGWPVTWPSGDEHEDAVNATASAERDLANSERRSAMILEDARSYLRKDQLASLAGRLARGTEQLRANLQELRDAGSPGDMVLVFRIGGGTPEEEANWWALHHKVFRAKCADRARDAGVYIMLDESRIQRLCDLLTERHMELVRVDRQRMMDGVFFPPEPYRDSVAREFGDEFADRWEDYTGISNGFNIVDYRLNTFYNAGVALTPEQRYRLAGCYPRVTVAALTQPASPATATGSGDTKAWLVRVEEGELERSEKLNAAVLATARGFLNDKQQQVLERLIDDELSSRRESVRLKRENAARQ